MGNIEPWEVEPTQDKLNIFVSSRLKECAAERAVAKAAITSINHIPVLFEHLGARSYKARNLYLSRLQDSTVMIAIHRLGYGYIDSAGGMTISGLEDELNFALETGIPVLLYVYEPADGREKRLGDLIGRAEKLLTINYYSDPNDLQRIKDDATAEITRLVLKPQITRGVLAESSKNLLARAVKRQGKLIDRTLVLESLKKVAQAEPVVCVYGSAGVGKTTLTAQLAEAVEGTYIRLAGFAPLDVFSLCCEAVTTGRSTEATHTSLTGARLAFASAWAEADEICLIVDECEFVGDLLKAINEAGGLTEKKRLVYTSRTPSQHATNFEVPLLKEGEARSFLRDSGVNLPSDGTESYSPLKLQQMINEAASSETKPSARGQEVMMYLALSPCPLSAEDLLELLGDDQVSPADLFAEMESLARLIDDSPSGFRVMHSEVANQIASEVHSSPQKFQFFSNRLIRMFEERSEYRWAYRVAEKSDAKAADSLMLKTLRQAAFFGDHRLGLDVSDRMLAKAENEGSRDDAFHLMLSLVYPLELMGNSIRAQELLATAEKLALDLKGDHQNALAEAKLASRARRTLADSDVRGLEEVYANYAEIGDDWNAGRIAIELSALYISSKRFPQAVDILRSAHAMFVDLGDEYGTDIAERNLAAALAGIPGNEAEVDALARKIESRSEGAGDSRRQRAWYLNILTRRYRTSGRLDDAEAAALEILEISSELGDEALSALTYVNLGNVYTDMFDAKRALDAYDMAGKAAQRCGRRDVEADASRLRAAVLNDLETSADLISNRFEEARMFAQYAIGLLEGTIYHEALARAFVELASAESELGNDEKVAASYFSAAKHFRKVPDEVGFDAALVRGVEQALDNDDDPTYVAELARALDIDIDPSRSLGANFITLIQPIILNTPKSSFLRILGRHLERVRSNLPTLLRPLLLKSLQEATEAGALSETQNVESWRLLYAGLISPFLVQDSGDELLLRRLATALTAKVDGLSVRYTEREDTVWTVVLGTSSPRIFSIIPLDETPASLIAAQSLAIFLKAFEEEFLDLLGGGGLNECSIQVAMFSQMPNDLQELMRGLGDVDEMIDEQSVLVTRTNDFSGNTPAMVFLHSDFVSRASTGLGVSGSLQSLFALTLTELLHTLLGGEVDNEQLRPKIISLVRQTMS